MERDTREQDHIPVQHGPTQADDAGCAGQGRRAGVIACHRVSLQDVLVA